jgi:hypothetical protein
LANQKYSEYLNDIFGSFDPEEDTIDEWYRTANYINDRWLSRLEDVFATDTMTSGIGNCRG